jgi:hypothetical protein
MAKIMAAAVGAVQDTSGASEADSQSPPGIVEADLGREMLLAGGPCLMKALLSGEKERLRWFHV